MSFFDANEAIREVNSKPPSPNSVPPFYLHGRLSREIPCQWSPPKYPVISNGKVFAKCQACGKVVQMNKPLLGSLHICVEAES